MSRRFVLVMALVFVSCQVQDPRVYISSTDGMYHTKDCSALGPNASPHRESAVIAQGYRPCPQCQNIPLPPNAMPVVEAVRSESEPLEALPLVAPEKTELEQRVELAKTVFTRSTEGQILEAAGWIAAEAVQYGRSLTITDGLGLMLDYAPKVEFEATATTARVAGDTNLIGDSASLSVRGVHGLSPREVSTAVLEDMYVAYWTPYWEASAAEQQRIAAQRERDMAATERRRQEREARQAATAARTNAIVEQQQAQGARDQAQRQREWVYGR